MGPMPVEPTDRTPEPHVVKKRRAPKKWPCPVCGKPGRRERERTYTVRHLAHKEPAVWEVTVGVYRAKCACRRTFMRKSGGRMMPVPKRVKYFTSTVEGVAQGAEYTDAVRDKIVDLVVRDRLPNSLVMKHLEEGFSLEVSVAFIYLCLDRAQEGAA